MTTVAKEAKQISIFLENRSGVVADLAASLTEQDIHIRALTVLDTHDIGTMRMVVDKHERAVHVLQECGAAYMEIPVLTIEIPNVVGGFAQIARAMANAGVNIEYAYGSAMPGSDTTLGVFRVNNVERALSMTFDHVNG